MIVAEIAPEVVVAASVVVVADSVPAVTQHSVAVQVEAAHVVLDCSVAPDAQAVREPVVAAAVEPAAAVVAATVDALS